MILALAFLAAAAVTSHSVPLNNCDEAGIRSFTAINNNFGLGLLKIFGEREEGNIFFSPSSLSALLSAIFYGSAGKTREELVGLGYLSIQYEDLGSFNPLLGYCLEIANTLKSQSDEYTLERSNAILVEKDYPVLQEYKNLVRKSFGAETKEVDFSGRRAVDEVNRWVREKTHGKISKLVDDLDEYTRLLFLSAIYFNGTWQTEFDAEKTKPLPFYNNGNSSPKPVPTMNLHAELPFFYDAQNQYRALQLPYKGNDVSMLILLPFETYGIERLQETIDSETIPDVLSKLRKQNVTVYLPKFKLEYSRHLKDDLTKGGLGAMFSPKADFSGITGGKDLYVSDIIHKAIVEVNEQGTEAAAITGGIMVPVSLPIPNPRNVFNANHPFLFFITDNRSFSNLFIGRVNEL